MGCRVQHREQNSLRQLLSAVLILTLPSLVSTFRLHQVMILQDNIEVPTQVLPNHQAGVSKGVVPPSRIGATLFVVEHGIVRKAPVPTDTMSTMITMPLEKMKPDGSLCKGIDVFKARYWPDSPTRDLGTESERGSRRRETR